MTYTDGHKTVSITRVVENFIFFTSAHLKGEHYLPKWKFFKKYKEAGQP